MSFRSVNSTAAVKKKLWQHTQKLFLLCGNGVVTDSFVHQECKLFKMNIKVHSPFWGKDLEELEIDGTPWLRR